jgi:uncharacterized membrane protein YfcA
VFTPGGLIAGALAALFVGVAKTGLPGSGLVAIPLIALVVDGRLIPGATLPLLLVADLFAVAWYRRHTRWDLLRPLGVFIGVGYLAGIAFFVMLGSANEELERSIGLILLAIIGVQLWRTYRSAQALEGRGAALAYGTTGGFTTFVANAAGPVINTYLASLRLPKTEFLGTAAWLYFVLNLSKIPFYIALGIWTEGGSFFTEETLAWNAALVPAIFAGVYVGRAVYNRVPQRAFLLVVLLLSAAGAVVLVV